MKKEFIMPSMKIAGFSRVQILTDSGVMTNEDLAKQAAKSKVTPGVAISTINIQ